VSVRLAADSDLDAAYGVREQWAKAVDERVLSRAFFESEWLHADTDAQDRLIAERDGRAIGYAVLHAGGEVTIRGEPDGLVPALERRGRERGAAALEAVVTTRDEAVTASLEAAGFERAREVWRMWLDLAEPQPPARLPDGISVRAYRDGDAPPLHELIELAFVANNERILPFDEWLRFMTAHDEFDPAFFHLAEAGDELVACALTWKPFERRGWLKDLAVHPEHRRRGLGEAMNAVAAAAYRAAGVERMGLKVDSDNPTGAPRLYGRLGYELDRVYAVYSLSLA